MSDQVEIEREFKRQVCDEIELVADGPNRFSVITPLTYDDGDLLPIVLREKNGEWVLSDAGRSLMHLTYEVDEADLTHGPRKAILDRALAEFSIENRSGELVRPLAGVSYGEALYGFIHALLKIDDIRFLSRERVKSTFLQDFRHFVEMKVPEERRVQNWHDPRHDPVGNYPVDYRINGRPRPLYLFALPTPERVNVATISLLQLERWGQEGDSVGVFEDQERIPRKTLARFMDVCGRVFSSLSAAEDRLPEDFPDVMIPG